MSQMNFCPGCGRKLAADDIVISVDDPTGKVMSWFHMPQKSYNEFLELADKLGKNPSDLYFDMVKAFLEKQGIK